MAILSRLAHCHPSHQQFRYGCGTLAILMTLLATDTLNAANGMVLPPANPVPTASPVTAKPATAAEYQLKAVFLFNFTKYVEWPAMAFTDTQSPFVIGVLGDDPFGAALDDAIRGEKMNGRALIVRRYNLNDEVKDCQILFISQSEDSRLEQIIAGLKGRNVLTVGDIDKFTDRGGMVGFATENSKIRLKINLEAVKAANLTISSSLLRAAEITGRARD
jgi:hypothetical protein